MRSNSQTNTSADSQAPNAHAAGGPEREVEALGGAPLPGRSSGLFIGKTGLLDEGNVGPATSSCVPFKDCACPAP
eukprot:1536798-Pyramimonas_sp.AAC.1